MREVPDHPRPAGRGPSGSGRGATALLLLDARARIGVAALVAGAIWVAVLWAVG